MPRPTDDSSDAGRVAAWLTRSPVAVLLLSFGAISSGGYASYSSLAQKFDAQGEAIRDLQEQIRSLTTEVARQNGDGWKRTEMRVWAAQMQYELTRAGVNITVPSVP